VTDEEMAFYRKRKLEIHEEQAREKKLRADLNLALTLKNAKVLKRRDG
jgi:hypothetical protein